MRYLTCAFRVAAVFFDDGDLASRIVHGDEPYRQMMARLSLPESKHLA